MKKWKKFMAMTCAVTLSMALQVTATETVNLTDDAAQTQTETQAETAVETPVTETTQDTVDKSKPLVALGANLTADQRAQVLSIMGLSEADLANYNVIYITNDLEHQYLDSYIDPAVIGTKSLSSVMITPKESGHGVLVTTQNINYCTTGMYRNALLTAGVENADILVAGPSPISGTAALIGAVKGYELLSGQKVSDTALDTALDEMITTGELSKALNDADSEEVEALIAFVKAKLAAGELDSEEDIRGAIAEGENKFGVKLDESEITQIVDVMNKIKKLGLDPNVLLDQAEDLYKQFGPDFLNHIDKKTIAKTGVSAFFSKIGQGIKSFFAGLFG